MRERADLGFADALEEFDPAEWAPKPASPPAPRPEKAETRKAAAAAGFRSREPRPEPERAGGALAPGAAMPQALAPAAGTPVTAVPVTSVPVMATPAPGTPVMGTPVTGTPVRRRRTGRNAQFNLKARPETIAAFCAVADQQGWGLGETLEHAVALLEREYGRS